MKVCKTLQLQILSQRDAIIETAHHFVNALNYTSRYAMERRTFTKGGLQKRIYGELRGRFSLRSQMAINCIREVDARYKGKFNVNRTKDRPVWFQQRHYALNYPRDYRLVNRNTISINTIHGRVKARYACGDHHRASLDSGGWTIASSIISIRRDEVVFINIVVEKELPETTLQRRDGVVGVDLGMNFVATTTDSTSKTRFFGGGKVKYRRWLYGTHRREAQSKGTRSAKRFLNRQRGRERRFVTAQNHAIAKEIVTHAFQTFGAPIIAMEDLTGVHRQPYVGKVHRTRLATWSFFQLQRFIEYKALERGIPVVYVDPQHTSQRCPRCGHVARANRHKRLHVFQCQSCGYTSNDDRVASINVRDRGVVFRYIRRTRRFVNSPSVAGGDAETSSEGLTPSLATSPRL
jgi:IS605 OrfB family transposase